VHMMADIDAAVDQGARDDGIDEIDVDICRSGT